MPELGDNEKEFEKIDYGLLPEVETANGADNDYHYLLLPTSDSLEDRYSDFREIVPNAGSYPRPESRRPCLVSMDALNDCGLCVVRRCIALTERAFAVVGKYLDLDYYGVASVDLRKRITLEEITGLTRDELDRKARDQLNRKLAPEE